MSIWRLSTVRSLILCAWRQVKLQHLKIIIPVMKNWREGTSWTMPQSHLSTSSPWLGHTLIRHMPGFLDLINCLAHNPTCPQALIVFQWRDRAHFVVFVRYFGISRRKKTFLIFVLFVWILYKFLSARAPAEDRNGNKKQIMNWLSLIRRSLLMDIFWALVGKETMGRGVKRQVHESL